ncbi:MAG: helix-turn-helix domain-containing protein [Candidatus Sericytochromatia bacterium]|nr:helix-turn-helix domain-containing protein [Candidatus Sericytochromatia bacterium]
MNHGLLSTTAAAVVDGAARSHVLPAPSSCGARLNELVQRAPLHGAAMLAGDTGGQGRVTGACVASEEGLTLLPPVGSLVVAPAGWLEASPAGRVGEVAEAGAAGLLVLTSAAVELVPEAALEAANRHGLPLLAMTHAAPPAEVARALEASLGTEDAGPEPGGGMLQRRLLDLVLDGSGLEAVARTLARALERTVVVEDRQFNLLAVGQAGALGDPFVDELIVNKGTPVETIKAWEADGTLATLRKQRQPVHLRGGRANEAPRSIHPLVINGEVHGYLSVLASEAPTGALAAAIDQGALAASLELLKQQGATESEQKLKRDFFRDLLAAETPAAVETLRRRATYLGYPMNATYWIVAVEFDERPLEEVQPEEVQRLAGVLNALLSFRQAVVVNQMNGATILYPLREGQPTPDKLAQLAHAIHQKVAATAPSWSVSIGVGQLHDGLMGVPQSYREALHALKIGRHTRGTQHTTFFSDLGIYRMLLQFAHSQDPNEFFCEPLQRLIEYNQQMDKELVKTIAAFLACNGNLTETSTRLFIHRNTLKYRLERIRDITQIDLDDAENRLMLHLGLKMNQVINYLR